MTVLHRPGSKPGNTDGLSRIPDQLEFCDCYQAGVVLKNLSQSTSALVQVQR